MTLVTIAALESKEEGIVYENLTQHSVVKVLTRDLALILHFCLLHKTSAKRR